MTVVLVTGGAGYIGSHGAKALKEAGFQPVVVDNLSRGHEWAVKWGPLERVDLQDAERLSDVFKRYKPAAVMHFAAYAYVGESTEEPYLYYRNNVAGTLSLLEVMRQSQCDKIVFSSTCATYGMPDEVPIKETTPQNPVNPYGASKLMVERMLADADTAYGLRSVCLRYFNASGADPENEIGEAHDPETHLLPLALQAAAGQGRGLKVFGSDYDTPDGSCIRDYIHVADLASAHVLAIRALMDGAQSDVFNLGNERGFSVMEVIRAVERVTGKPVPHEIVGRRAGDPAKLVACADKARDVLGWNPKFPDLEDQISHAWKWLSHQQRLGTDPLQLEKN